MAASTLVFAGSFAACAGIAPGGLALNEGMSSFGAHVATFGPYCVGVWAVSIGTWAVARSIEDRVTGLLLRAISVLTAVVVLTSSSLGPVFNAMHVAIGSSAFTLALVLSVRASVGTTSRTGRPPVRGTVAASLLAEIVSWIVSGWWLLQSQGHLIWAQTFFFIAFMVNATTWLPRQPRRRRARSSARDLLTT